VKKKSPRGKPKDKKKGKRGKAKEEEERKKKGDKKRVEEDEEEEEETKSKEEKGEEEERNRTMDDTTFNPTDCVMLPCVHHFCKRCVLGWYVFFSPKLIPPGSEKKKHNYFQILETFRGIYFFFSLEFSR
jgi:hypothetical protein